MSQIPNYDELIQQICEMDEDTENLFLQIMEDVEYSVKNQTHIAYVASNYFSPLKATLVCLLYAKYQSEYDIILKIRPEQERIFLRMTRIRQKDK